MESISTDVVSKIAVNAFTEIFKSCYYGIKTAGRWFADENKEHDFFGVAARRYISRVEERYDTIRIFGMTEPIKLGQIYTKVNILEKITSQQRETVEDLSRVFDRDTRSFKPTIEKVSGMDVVNNISKFILLGKPGGGKTTFLKYIALQAARGRLSQKRIPIFIGLKSLADSNLSVMDFIVEQFDICNFPDARPFIERVLEGGKCLLLFDGLDEVPKAKEDLIIQQLNDLTDKYYLNQFVLSCRIAAYNYCFEKFTDVEMADFDDEQIEDFVCKWFSLETETAELCLKEMFSNPPIRELARIPLLLVLLCLAFDESMGFPSNKAELYKEAIDALLKRWDTSRKIKRDEIYQNLSISKKENMFCRVAVHTFVKDQYFIPQSTLREYIAEFIKDLPEIGSASLELDSELILKSIEAHHGIFVERARGIYSFSHLTVQEYFTARYIVDNATKGTVETLVRDYLLEDKWREVILIVAGMLKEADDFLRLIKSKIDAIVNRPTAKFLRAIQRVKVEHPIEAREDSAVGMARDISFSQALNERDPYFLCVDRALTLEKFFSSSQISSDVIRKHSNILSVSNRLSEGLQNVLHKDLDLNLTVDINFKLINMWDLSAARATRGVERFGKLLTPALVSQLTDYLKGHTVLVDCLKSDCFVSKKTRRDLFERMLIV